MVDAGNLNRLKKIGVAVENIVKTVPLSFEKV